MLLGMREDMIKSESNYILNDLNHDVELRLESTGDLESKDLSSIPTSTTW
jgi:hypothetical protein